MTDTPAEVLNTGHGHARPRPDGVKARCGGPSLCGVCQQERAAIDAMPSAPAIAGGSPDNMLQDQNRDLSQWLSNQPGARLHATEAAAAIARASEPADYGPALLAAWDKARASKGSDQPHQRLFVGLLSAWGLPTTAPVPTLAGPHPDCDSPDICAAHGSCVGRVGTQHACESARSVDDQTCVGTPDFEAWWSKHGQFVRPGGGGHEKCFAFSAWCAANPAPAVAATVQPLTEAEVAELLSRRDWRDGNLRELIAETAQVCATAWGARLWASL